MYICLCICSWHTKMTLSVFLRPFFAGSSSWCLKSMPQKYKQHKNVLTHLFYLPIFGWTFFRFHHPSCSMFHSYECCFVTLAFALFYSRDDTLDNMCAGTLFCKLGVLPDSMLEIFHTDLFHCKLKALTTQSLISEMSSLLSVRKLLYKFRGSQRWLLQWCKTWTKFNYSCTGPRFPRFSGSIRQAPWQSSKKSWDSWAEPVQVVGALSWGILGLRRHFRNISKWRTCFALFRVSLNHDLNI